VEAPLEPLAQLEAALAERGAARRVRRLVVGDGQVAHEAAALVVAHEVARVDAYGAQGDGIRG